MIAPGHFYTLCVVGCLGGWTWIGMAWSQSALSVWKGCLLKQFLHIPCPACGSTRAMVVLLHGGVRDALVLNPLGVISFLLLLWLTLGLLYDGVLRCKHLYHSFLQVDAWLHQSWVFFLFVGVILFNWWWIW